MCWLIHQSGNLPGMSTIRDVTLSKHTWSSQVKIKHSFSPFSFLFKSIKCLIQKSKEKNISRVVSKLITQLFLMFFHKCDKSSDILLWVSLSKHVDSWLISLQSKTLLRAIPDFRISAKLPCLF